MRVLLFLTSLVLGACAPKTRLPNSGPDPKVLVQADLQAMAGMDSASVQEFDAHHGQAFTLVFGGTTASAVRAYFDVRIHHILSEADLSRSRRQPANFMHQGWTDAHAVSNLLRRSSQVEIGAANVGTEWWLNGLIDEVPVSLLNGGERIDLNSARTGVVVIGPGYAPSVLLQGHTVALPSVYRQQMLLHEARHSDCTGGVTETQLSSLRDSRSYVETERVFNTSCGHLHTFCPLGHQLQGLLACDAEPWGAYSVGYVFGRGIYAGLSGNDRAVMDAQLVDDVSRLLFDSPAKMLSGQLGAPDMSSSTVVGADAATK